MGKIYNKICSLFSGKNSKIDTVPKKVAVDTRATREELFCTLELGVYDDVKYVNGYDENKKTILIMDDLVDTYTMYVADFDKLKVTHRVDIMNTFNVVTAIGPDTGFIAYKALCGGLKIDYAILDITVGNKIKFKTGEFLEIDGVDIGILCLKNKAKVLFSTVHRLDKNNVKMCYYINKFKRYDDKDITDFAMNKNGPRTVPICEFLFDVKSND